MGATEGSSIESGPQMVQEAVSRTPGYVPLCENSALVSSFRDPSSSLQNCALGKRTGPGYVFSVACSSRPLLEAAKSFRPELIGGTRLKLLEQWTAACKLAAEEFADLEDEALAYKLTSSADMSRLQALACGCRRETKSIPWHRPTASALWTMSCFRT